jgi:Protein of unknown function (DUF2750)
VSIAAPNAAAFFTEARQEAAVWTIRDEGGFPAPMNGDGKRSQPFWSKAGRAEKVVSNSPAYRGFSLHQIALSEFLDRWLPGLERDGLLVGLNWAGDRATGYDFEPSVVRERLGTR